MAPARWTVLYRVEQGVVGVGLVGGVDERPHEAQQHDDDQHDKAGHRQLVLGKDPRHGLEKTRSAVKGSGGKVLIVGGQYGVMRCSAMREGLQLKWVDGHLVAA